MQQGAALPQAPDALLWQRAGRRHTIGLPADPPPGIDTRWPQTEPDVRR